VRAAFDARTALAELDRELREQFGMSIEIRTGISTGEVVVGSGDQGAATIVGDALNVAARLEQSATAGDVLIGGETFAIVRHAIRAEPLEPLHVRGKADALVAYRVFGVLPGAGIRQRRHRAPIVGRAAEVGLIRGALSRATSAELCHLVTVLGAAGVGKSRLVEAALAEQEATVLSGRCLPYGDGVTFWALGEIIRGAAGVPENAKVESVVTEIARLVESDSDSDAVARTLAQMVGVEEGLADSAQASWAVRRLLEALARREPLVVVFDDIQWAEPLLLDLIEHVAALARDAPLLLVCMARPELLERRTGWGGGLRNATAIYLEPLGLADSVALIRNVPGGGALPDAACERIAAETAGTPLFLEEMVAMLIDTGVIGHEHDAWRMKGDLDRVSLPPTIQAVLASRLDLLESEERLTIELASIVGQEFSQAAVCAIAAPEVEKRIPPLLESLTRKDLIVPVWGGAMGSESLRFRHLLIRDAAYDTVPKARRAELHERFASWLEQTYRERIAEVEEIVGYHLEQAHGYRVAAEPAASAETVSLAQRAAAHLGAAGRRAMARRDMAAAVQLLERARALQPPGSRNSWMTGIDVAHALSEAGAFDAAGDVLDEVLEASSAAPDEAIEAHARLELAQVRLAVDPEGAAAAGRVVADRALPGFRRDADHAGIARALIVSSEVDHLLARFGPYVDAQEEALEHLRRAGERHLIPEILATIAHGTAIGPTPTSIALVRLRELEREGAAIPELVAKVRLRIGYLLALQGSEREAIEAKAEAEALADEFGGGFHVGSFGLMAGELERVLGRVDHAERYLRASDEVLSRSGERSVRSTTLAVLSNVMLQGGELQEAERTARLALETGSSDDLATVACAQITLAGALCARREPGATQAARAAVQTADRTDVLCLQAQAREVLAEALAASGHAGEAQTELRGALERYERKEARLLASRVKARIETIPSASR
jgi:tetratricopeptide (TPR) repeat protein